MSDFNMPPGCRVSDIPGNSPEDLEELKFWEELYAKFTWIDCDHTDEIDQEKLEELVNWVRNRTWNEAYCQAQDDLMDKEDL